MQVTEVRIRKVNQDGSRMKAVCSVTFDDVFVVHDIKVVESEKGLFIAMPSKRTPAGEFRDIAHPITSEARQFIQDAILKAYQEME
ncbi:MAG TPA: septation regulator SpoVG [Syntrophomonadaceae bacterium]|nr:septation regulator SpoVG [Syntrophomonadaceae bacterium]